jgi:hypothetical protein
MAEQLNDDILDFIESISITAKKEAAYIKKNNWADISDPKFRSEEFDLQNLLVDRNLSHASSLYRLAKADLKHPAVKAMLDELIATFRIHGDRISKYILESDWTEQLTEGASRGAMKQEIEFQSEMNKNLAKFKADVRKLNYSDEALSVDIQTYGDIVVPLLMESAIQQRFPEITEFLDKKREKFYKENPKQVVVEEKPKKVRKPVKKFKLQKLPNEE